MYCSNLKRPEFRVLFISQTARINAPFLDPSVRYRCYNPAEIFVKYGVIADVIAQQNATVEMIEHYDAFVFHRPYGGDPNLQLLVEKATAQKKITIADYDDLIFDPEFALQSSIYLNRVRNEIQTKAVFTDNFIGLKLFDFFTCSTEPLKKHIEHLIPNAKVAIVSNGLSESLLSGFKFKQRYRIPQSIQTISYLSGTASHNLDFDSIAATLDDFLQKHKKYRICVSGPLQIDRGHLNPRFLIHFPHKEFYDFFESTGKYRFNIAPLAGNNVFNECKSALKFFESGIWGVPTIASPLPDFLRFKDSTGLILALEPDEWLDALEKLADDEYYQSAVSGLHEYCVEHCLAKPHALKLLNFIQENAAQ